MWRPLFFLTLTGSACLTTPDLTGGSGDPVTTDDAPSTGPQTTADVSSGSTTTIDIGSTSDGTGTTAPITADLTTSDASESSDTTDTTGADGSSTGAPLEKCGDGIVDADLGEECDQADGCYQCIRDRIVFTSKATLKGAQIAGLKGADDLCLQYAGAAGLPNPLTYRAWLSDSKTDARDRLFLSEGRYVTTAGVVVVIGKGEWISGVLRAPIDRDQTGEPTTESVWTGTTEHGLRAAEGPPDEMKYCKDWTSDDLFDEGYIGSSQSKDGTWTFYTDVQVNPTSCAFDFSLYCIEGK